MLDTLRQVYQNDACCRQRGMGAAESEAIVFMLKHFDRLTLFLREPGAVASNPAQWMPWNYTASLARPGPAACPPP